MSNYHFKDKRLSLKAKGLLSQMLSLPDNWDYSMNGLAAINKENITAIKTALKELREFRYLKITKVMPDKSSTGRIEYIYDIYEQPFEIQEKEKQGIESLGVENHTQLKTNNKKIKDKINNIYLTEFESIWSLYPRKVNRQQAYKAYEKARKSGVEFVTIFEGVQRYKSYVDSECTEEKYIKHGATWINQECWNDEYKVKQKDKKKSDYSFDLEALDIIK